MDVYREAERFADIAFRTNKAEIVNYIDTSKNYDLQGIYSDPKYDGLFDPSTVKALRDASQKGRDEGRMAGLLERGIMWEIIRKGFDGFKREHRNALNRKWWIDGSTYSIADLESVRVIASFEDSIELCRKISILCSRELPDFIGKRQETAEAIAHKYGYADAVSMARRVYDIDASMAYSGNLLMNPGRIPTASEVSNDKMHLQGKEMFGGSEIGEKVREYKGKAMGTAGCRMSVFDGEKAGNGAVSASGFVLSSDVSIPAKSKKTNPVDKLSGCYHELSEGFSTAGPANRNAIQFYSAIIDRGMNELFGSLGDRVAATEGIYAWHAGSGYNGNDSEKYVAVEGRRWMNKRVFSAAISQIDIELMSGRGSEEVLRRCGSIYQDYLAAANPDINEIPGVEIMWFLSTNIIVPLSSQAYVAALGLPDMVFSYVGEMFGPSWTNPDSPSSREAWGWLSDFAESLESPMDIPRLIEKLEIK